MYRREKRSRYELDAGQDESRVDLCGCQCQCGSPGGDEVPGGHTAAAVESDSGGEQSGAGAADTKRTVPGQCAPGELSSSAKTLAPFS